VPTPSKTADDTPQRRQPIKTQKIAGITVSIVHRGTAYMLVTHYPDGRRTRERMATLNVANAAFQRKTAMVVRDGAEVASAFSSADARAVRDFHAAVSQWDSPPTVAEALSFFLAQKQSLATAGTVSSAVEKRKTDVLRRARSHRHQKDLENRLDRFNADFGGRPLISITGADIEQWISSLEVAPQTQENFRRVIGSIFTDAVAAGHLTRNPASVVRLPKVVEKEPETISAQQLARLLSFTPRRSLAAVAIQALAGLRLTEVQELQWEQVSLSHKLITVAPKKTKRRHVPVTPALLEWITELHQGTGAVAQSKDTLRNDCEAARRKAAIDPWPANALRHSCCSAWCTLEGDISRVASWLGNTPSMVNRHYRALKTADEAADWFNVRPVTSAEGTVLPFSVAG
jgi:integrase